MTLSSLGWDDFFSRHFAPHASGGLVPARVALEHKHAYELYSPLGEMTAECTGRLLHTAATRADLPAVGDWVAVHPRPGEATLDRQTPRRCQVAPAHQPRHAHRRHRRRDPRLRSRERAGAVETRRVQENLAL